MTTIARPLPRPGRPVKLRGESVRTGAQIAMKALNPIAQTSQTVANVHRVAAGASFLAPAARWAAGILEGIARWPLFQSRLLQRGPQLIERAVPIVSAVVTAFDGYAAIKTQRTAGASTRRKAITWARFAASAATTALSFIPGWGVLAACPAGWASLGLDLWLKRMNQRGEA